MFFHTSKEVEFMQYAWIAFIDLAIIVEAATSGLVAIWFIPGALVSMLLAILNVELWIQITVFAVITVVMLILSERYFKKMFKIKPHATNADAVIGQSAVVTEKICNIGGPGAVNGQGMDGKIVGQFGIRRWRRCYRSRDQRCKADL